MTTLRRGVVTICCLVAFHPYPVPLSCNSSQISSQGGRLLLYVALEGLSTKVSHSPPSRMWARPTSFSFPGLQTQKNDKEWENIWRQFINFLSSYHPWASKYSWFPELSESRSLPFLLIPWLIQYPFNQVPLCSTSPESVSVAFK